MKRLKKIAPFLLFAFLFLGLVIRLYKTKSQPFYDWDEGIYAEVAKEILKNRSLNTTFNGHPWLNKPPLSHLLIALSFLIFGCQELPARAIFMLFGFLTLIFLYKLTRKILSDLFNFKTSHLALLPPLILASTPIFLERSTTLNTDIIIALSWLGYFLYLDNFVVKTIFLLLGVWSKSLVGFYPLFIEPFLWLREKLSLKNLIKKVLAFIGQIFLASLWYIYAYLKHGNYFIKAHFLDQIFKRVTAPIELHFGNKWYYFELLWKNLNFVNFFLLIGLIILIIDGLKLISAKRLRSIKDKKFLTYIVLFSPLPFLALLIIGKSKIYWYLLFILPFLTIYPIFLLAKLNKKLRFVLALLLTLFSLFQFTKQTFLFKPKLSISEKVKLAKCLNKKGVKNLAFLVDEDERKIKNVLEAAHLQTETSFVYGGSPSFVFYLNRPLKYYYKLDNFLKEFKQYQSFVASEKDLPLVKKNLLNYKKVCEFGKWKAFKKKTL